jgi:SAM-dependent methyltransferase
VPEINWIDDFLPILLRPSIIPNNVKDVLDVGCGRGILAPVLRTYREPRLIVGLDFYEPYLSFVAGMRMYDSLIRLDLSSSSLPFIDKSFDIVLCLEVIEHLEKQHGLRLLDELERVGRRVVISTPGMFFPQSPLDDNPRQVHRSLFRVRELERRGYRVFGVGNLTLVGRQSKTISAALGRLTYFFPGLSGTILGIRE